MPANFRKYFSTDGIRGRVGEEPITPDFMMKLGWAFGKVLHEKTAGPILIGKDTRVSGYMFESALEAGLSAAGLDVRLLGPLPTPAVAFLTKNTRAVAGIVISASHNPYFDNGIKIFSRNGRKLSDTVEWQIEQQLGRPLEVVESDKLGKARRITDAPRRYIEFCKSKVDCGLSGLRLVVDCANGATYRIAPKVFEELGAEVHAIGVEPDGFNINDGCGATRPEALQQVVLKKNADAGISLDGDGDRLIMVDHRGERVDGDELLYIIAGHQRKALNGGVVGTLMSNLGLEQALQAMGFEFYQAEVGDRYVAKLLHEKNLVLGGEQSGHIVNRKFADTGDGIISALQVLNAVLDTGEDLHSLKRGLHKYPQTLMNITLNKPVRLADYPELEGMKRKVEEQLEHPRRVLLRLSGTEPVLRVMVEGNNDAGKVRSLTRQLVKDVGELIGA